MDYNQTTQWLFRQLPMYQQQGASAYRKDLLNTLLLAEHLGNPEKNLNFIHVAGTNGKGSTSHMLASILQDAGYKTGLYTSPHLKDFRERIKINGKEIPTDFVVEFTQRNKLFFESQNLSFFEMTVGMAFEYFHQENVDIAVIETGLGGRLDATNIITPIISVITNISYDHMQFLGNTLEEIATEKAGIIKPGVPIVIGEYSDETKPVFISKAMKCNSEIYFASDEIENIYPSDLNGNYQKDNIKTVLKTIYVLRLQSFSISDENIKSGLMHVASNTGLQGRWQQVGDHPKIICDTAHNPAGIKIVMRQIEEEKFENLHIVLGVVNDKDLNEMLPLFPKKAIYYFCKPDLPRGLDQNILAENSRRWKLYGDTFDSVAQAFSSAKSAAGINDFIYAGGSTFVVAEILE